MRLVLRHERGSRREAICSVAEELGPKPETVRLWVRQAQRDTGRRPGATTAELEGLRRLGVRERRANDLLNATADSLGVELDRQSKM